MAPELRSVSGFGLDEALSRVPGVIAQSRYGTSDIRLMIRGYGARGAGDRSNSGTSRGVRVLLDGFPETEPDGRTALDQLDLATAEAVEVMRSNASSLWGNAAGGVVNVITVPSMTVPSYEFQPIFGGFGLARYAARTSMPIGGGTGVDLRELHEHDVRRLARSLRRETRARERRRGRPGGRQNAARPLPHAPRTTSCTCPVR